MSLNIKNEETCRLAGELARLTGETMTGAITVALRARLARGETPAKHGGPGSQASRHRPMLCFSSEARASGRRTRRYPLR